MSIILIVEDEETTRHLLTNLFQEAGHETLWASDGAMALGLLRENEVDLVVTDLAMPRINGLRMIREIRNTGDSIPIIAVSGKNADQLLLAEDYGANASISKPVDKEELLGLATRIFADTRNNWSDAWIHPEFGSVADK